MTRVKESGGGDAVTLDGVTINVLPHTFDARPSPAIALWQTMGGLSRVSHPYRGSAQCSQADSWEFALDWSLYNEDGTGDDADTLDLIEQLRVTARPILFVDWKARKAHYVLTPGQAGIYLPRADAFGMDYTGFESQATYGATAKLGGVAIATIAYQTSVTSATAVTAGQLWISKTPVAHPYTGQLCAYAKLGTAPVTDTDLYVEYMPLFRVKVTGAPTRPWSGFAGREERSLYMLEVG